MRVIVDERDSCGLLPPAYSYLRNVEMRSSQRKATRPALGIYNVSLDLLVATMADALDEVIGIQDKNYIPVPKDGLLPMYSVTDAWTTMLHAAHAHIDDVKSIASRALSKDSPWKTKEGRRFRRSIRDYEDRLGRIVNHIKHWHGRLRPFAFYTSQECFPGYYVEGVHESGCIGPEPTVHRHGKGAFSFSRESRLHFAWIYLLSSELARLLESIGVSPCAPSANPVDDWKYWALAQRVESIAERVFPDERHLTVPRVVCRSGDQREIECSYADDGSSRSIPRSMHLRIATVWHGDGVSRNFAVPYKYREGPGNQMLLERTR